MLRRPIVIVLLGIVGLAVVFHVAVGLAPERYSVREQPAEMAVAWRNDDALIFVPMQRMGRRTSILIDKFGAWLPWMMHAGMDVPVWLPSSSRVFHVANGRVTPFELKGMGSDGHFVIAEGAPALVKCGSCSEKALGYRWNGAEMARMDEAEAERLYQQGERRGEDPISLLQKEKEEFAAAGWNFDRMPLWGARERKLKFEQGKKQSALLFTGPGMPDDDSYEPFDWAGGSGPMSLTLRGPDGADRALLGMAGEWKRLSKEEFFAQVPPETRETMGSLRPMMFGPMMLVSWLFSSFFFLIPALPCILPFYWALGYRSRTLKTLPDTYDFQPAAPSEFAGIDQAKLDELTAALEQLGFRHARDFSLVPDAGKFTPDFSRLLIHPEHHCFAQIVQFFPPKRRPRPMAVVLHSVFEDDWSLSTSPDCTPAMTYHARLPHALWFRVPGAKPAELLNAHLVRRQQMAAGLNLGVEGNLNFAKYQSYVLGRYADRRAALRKGNLLFGPREALVFRFRPPQEWLGDAQRATG